MLFVASKYKCIVLVFLQRRECVCMVYYYNPIYNWTNMSWVCATYLKSYSIQVLQWIERVVVFCVCKHVRSIINRIIIIINQQALSLFWLIVCHWTGLLCLGDNILLIYLSHTSHLCVQVMLFKCVDSNAELRPF